MRAIVRVVSVLVCFDEKSKTLDDIGREDFELM